MPLKDMEHDGGDDYTEEIITLPFEENAEKFKIAKEKKEAEDKEEELIRKQKEYMNPNNPALWETLDGDWD